MTALAEIPRITRQPRDTTAKAPSESGAATIDKTLAQWDKFLGKQPGCDCGFSAAPGQAMRAVNVSSAAQVPMILRELHRSDGSIRIHFPSSADPKVIEDQVKIRAFLQEHHGKDLASLKSELVTLLEGSHSFQDLQSNTKFTKAYASAEQWIDANLSGVSSNSSKLHVTDVVSVRGDAEQLENKISGVIASLQDSQSRGRGTLVTASHADAQDQSLKDAIRAKLGESSQIDPSKVKVWIGAEAGGLTKSRPTCEGVRELSLAEFLAPAEVPLEATTSARNEDLVVGSLSASAAGATSEESGLITVAAPEPTSDPVQVDPLADLQIGAVASKVAQEAASTAPATETLSETIGKPTTAPTQATDLKVGVAVDNHRRGRDQEDRYLVRPFPAVEPEQAKEYLRLGVAAIDEVTKDNTSGSTFSGVVVTEDGDLVIAHLGDSPASAVIIDKDGNLKEAVPLLVEHKPGDGLGTSPSGREFFDNGKYRIINYDDRENRLGVAMTHALGDAQFGDVLSHTPELHVHQIQKRLREGDRLFLLVTSDGAHNEGSGVTHHGHAETIAKRLSQNKSLAEIASQIATDSAPIRDNVTVALLEVEKGKGAFVAVFDGHGGSETSDQAEKILRELTERFDKEDTSATTEEVARLVALEEKLKSLQQRLDDAWELRGEFSEAAELVKIEERVKEKLTAVARIRELQTQCLSEAGEESGPLRREMREIYDKHNMSTYAESGASFERNVDLFESDWLGDLSDIQRRIEAYDDRTLIPAMERMQAEISEIEKKILVA